jgi:hypothetical protein
MMTKITHNLNRKVLSLAITTIPEYISTIAKSEKASVAFLDS